MSDQRQFVDSLIEQIRLLPSDKVIAFLRAELNKISDPDNKSCVETMLLMELSKAKAIEDIVVLIHGIRTNAEWQNSVQTELEGAGISKVFKIGYGFFDAVRFWIPLLFRQYPVKRIQKELRGIQQDHRNANISVLAHSFGTYIISRILINSPDIRLHRVVLCGSIISESYDWDLIPNKPTGRVVNEVGVKDYWPVFAQATTFGYGASGRFGFKTHRVEDRYHDVDHSGFFVDSIVKNYWVPFFVRGDVVNTNFVPPAAPYWALMLPLLKYILIAALLFSSLMSFH